MLLNTSDIMPVMVSARGCAAHARFTKYAWGVDFGVRRKAIPVLDFAPTQVVRGDYTPQQEQLHALRRLTEANGIRMIVLLSGDNVLLSAHSLDDLSALVQQELGIPAPVLPIGGLSGSNPWVGYDAALGIVYQQVWDTAPPEADRTGVNLLGWKWASRDQDHDIGACLDLLQRLQVTVNHVLPGGASLADFADSLRSRVNLLWCSSYIGQTLHRLEEEKGLRLAGRQTPYGFAGTLGWIDELATALENPTLSARGRELANSYQDELRGVQQSLKGKRTFVSGGPGRLLGLLQAMVDLQVEVVAVALYWIHDELRPALEHLLAGLPSQPEVFLVSPSLYELEEVAQQLQPDVWLGGYQEMHPCKKYQVPFVPTTLYVKSHQGFEGCIRLGKKMLAAMDGFDFVANPFVTKEMAC
jgi:nitrogenase molybdenum-iron protein alpha/beta subunit